LLWARANPPQRWVGTLILNGPSGRMAFGRGFGLLGQKDLDILWYAICKRNLREIAGLPKDWVFCRVAEFPQVCPGSKLSCIRMLLTRAVEDQFMLVED